MFEPTIEKVSEDARGEIYVINLPNNQELVLLHSKAGTLRGGHAHDVDEVVVLLSGAMDYTKKSDGEAPSDYKFIGTNGGHTFNPAHKYHMAEFKEDSWVLEWKINTDKHSWKNIDYAPWRELVNANASQ